MAMKLIIVILATLCLKANSLHAQSPNENLFFEAEDDLQIGGDIFTDFNEDLEAAQVMEDERYYRYSRFVSLNLGIGKTSFTGNRGLAYENDNNPSYHLGLMYFMDFQNVFVMGLEYSQHVMLIDTFVNGSEERPLGAVQTSMLRPYFGFRYYLDTSDLGTAITYSNPYVVGRFEYWYQTNRFLEDSSRSDQTEGGVGTAAGFGLEFPIELKKTFFNIEFLYHTVNFFDRYTQDYREVENPDPGKESKYGYQDLTGDVITVFFNYTISW